MARLSISLSLCLLVGAASGVVIAKEPTRTTAAVSHVALQDLVAQPQRYAGKTVSVTGRYAGMCADGADFYFKDRLTTIEVLLPPGGMPDDLKVGTPLQVRGQIQVRKESNGESEVRIKPTAVTVDRAAAKKKS